MAVTIVAWLVATAHAAPPAVYDVIVVGAIGERRVSSLATIEARTHGRTLTFVTTRTAGTMGRPDGAWAYDSDAPTGHDPWFLAVQHLVATAPAAVRTDAGGGLVALQDPEAWVLAARNLVYSAPDLPTAALQSAEELIDPRGLFRDLQRNFPGAPPEGSWARPETIAGVEATRTERCEVARGRDLTSWTCAGTAESLDTSASDLDVTTMSTITRDRRGLVAYESAWSGTMRVWDPDGARWLEARVGERRGVERR